MEMRDSGEEWEEHVLRSDRALMGWSCREPRGFGRTRHTDLLCAMDQPGDFSRGHMLAPEKTLFFKGSKLLGN